MHKNTKMDQLKDLVRLFPCNNCFTLILPMRNALFSRRGFASTLIFGILHMLYLFFFTSIAKYFAIVLAINKSMVILQRVLNHNFMLI